MKEMNKFLSSYHFIKKYDNIVFAIKLIDYLYIILKKSAVTNRISGIMINYIEEKTGVISFS